MTGGVSMCINGSLGQHQVRGLATSKFSAVWGTILAGNSSSWVSYYLSDGRQSRGHGASSGLFQVLVAVARCL